MTMPKLSNFINKNIDLILAEWEKFAMDIVPVRLSPERARDHAKGMLRAIVADMKQTQTPDEQSDKSQGLAPENEVDSQAQLHGSERQVDGFSMPDTVSEFRALRATVMRLWNDSSATAMQSDIDGLMRFNESIDQLLAESVVRFASDKEAIANRLAIDLKRATTISDTIIECAPGGFFMIDEESRLVRWNKHFRKETGLSDEQLRGQAILICIHEQDRALAAAKFLTAFATGYTSMEIRVPTADRGIRLYLKTARRFEVDGVPYVASFGIDVTERKLAEAALKNEKEFFDAMVESTPGAFYVIDAEGNYRRWNKQLNHLTGLTDHDLQIWMIDIDHFKAVNDTWGHHGGDVALQSLMATSRQTLRDWGGGAHNHLNRGCDGER